MTNFIEAFNQSIKEADALEAQKTDIATVFRDLQKQIQTASNGVIKIIINEIRGDIDDFGIMPHLYSVQNMLSGKKIKSYSSISGEIAIANKSDYSVEIARWKTSPEGGFPCSLIYSNMNIEIHDKLALELALADLISSTHAGVIFKALLEKDKREKETNPFK